MRLRRLMLAVALCLAAIGAAGAEPTVSLAVVGDIMLDEVPGRLIRRGVDPFAGFAGILDAADIRVGNLECVVATTGKAEPDKPYTFRAHPRVLKPLKRHFDAVTLANNHSGDFGPAAFGQMLGLLRRAGIGYFGGGADLAEAHAPLLIERKGLRIAFLGYDEFFPRSFEADVGKPGVAWSEDEQVVRDIGQARRAGADLVIAVMHWGWEHETVAGARQRQLAHLIIDSGADAVIGGHPHVIQDTEVYRGKPIVYSLGNFVFNGFDDDASNTGWLLDLELDGQGVMRWRTVVARLDGNGLPHAVAGSTCWRRGEAAAKPCGE